MFVFRFSNDAHLPYVNAKLVTILSAYWSLILLCNHCGATRQKTSLTALAPDRIPDLLEFHTVISAQPEYNIRIPCQTTNNKFCYLNALLPIPIAIDERTG